MKPLVKLRLPEFNLDWVAQAMNTDRKNAGKYFCDGRLTHWVIAFCLAVRGFDLEEDKKATAGTKQSGGGFILRSKKTGAGYKLKIATKKLDLAPPENSGVNRTFNQATVLAQQQVIDGYAIVFTAELCQAPPMPPLDAVYFISNAMCRQLVDAGVLNKKFRADESEPVLEYFRDKLGEPSFKKLTQAAVAESLQAAKQ